MTKADICNVEWHGAIDDVVHVIGMLVEAGRDHCDAIDVDNDAARWTVADGKGVE